MKKNDNKPKVSIPHHMVEAEILTKLSLTSLARFKSVSKQWNSLIASHNFMKLHVQRRLKTSCIPSELFALQFGVCDVAEYLSRETTQCRPLLSTIRTSDDDSLLECRISTTVDNTLNSGWNRAIYAPGAPNKHNLLHSGVGIDLSTDELKSVLILRDKASNELTAHINTYKDEDWRKLPIDTSWLEHNVKDRLMIPSFAEFSPAQVNNTLRWILGHRSNGHQILLSFDLTEETFTVLPLGHHNGDHDGYLFAKLDDEYVYVGHGKDIAMYRVLAPFSTLMSTRDIFAKDSTTCIIRGI